MSLEDIIVTYVIDSHEGRDMNTIDIPGQYLHTESYEYLIMILNGVLEEFLGNINSKLYNK